MDSMRGMIREQTCYAIIALPFRGACTLEFIYQTHTHTHTVESIPRKPGRVRPVVYWFPKGPRPDDLFRFRVAQTPRNRSVGRRQWCTVVRDSTPLLERSVAIYCGSTRFMNRTANRFRLKQRNSGFNRVKPVRPLCVMRTPFPPPPRLCFDRSRKTAETP